MLQVLFLRIILYNILQNARKEMQNARNVISLNCTKCILYQISSLFVPSWAVALNSVRSFHCLSWRPLSSVMRTCFVGLVALPMYWLFGGCSSFSCFRPSEK
ncbi:Hypothetical_protein [Hexamita inflata]|uniref:Hypothetical_protein n=1 Tax=Hexamita inflata TaxID=28002 RepID=A0AA86PRZ2_9EUKA|nr:Hypothetical protein HINF_LOCUS30038 [Hexamita inflata]